MVEDSINSEQEPPVKRRSRLFGGRKAARKAAESVAPATPVASAASAPDARVGASGSTSAATSAAPLAPSAERQPGAATREGAADTAASLAGTRTTGAGSASVDVKAPVSDFHDSNPPDDNVSTETTEAEVTEAEATAAAEAPETATAPESDTAPQTTVTRSAFEPSSSDPREPWLEPELGQPPAAPQPPVARTTTSLLFQAPDIQPLPPRPRGANDRDDDYDSDDRDDDAGNRDTTIRRRTRRRSGDESRLPDDLPPNTVVKVRAPRQAQAPELITEPQRVKGSTRLEAKKQRRRDGRDAGRRRPVITEAEFLARRESVDRAMIVRSSHDRIQIGVLEDGVLVEHYVAKAAEASLIGNVYLGRVQNVLPSMEAAFVDIGRGRNAVLYSGEVDWDAADTGNQPRRIELALKPGDTVLVQVTKDPVGHKGARLTSQVSLPGRYLVYVPNGNMNGISRKLPDTERSRLKRILKEVLPEKVGVIVRTAAEGATEEQLTLDVNRLISQWAAISDNVKALSAPALLHGEPDLLIKIIRDVFNEDFHRLVISGTDARQTIEAYLAQVAPDLVDRIEVFEGQKDIFDEFRISEQIEKALDRKVWLPSGGSLVIDRTEAMTVVDVNTGKFVGSGGNLEETVTKNNLEAADEVVRQMRLRDIGGIIVVDFIDMVLESNRDLVLRRLVECLSRDRTKHQVAEVTSLGLVQMTRKKLGLGLLESFSEPCEVCAGRGVVIHHDPVSKHRTQQQTPQPEQRRSRGKGGASNGGGSGNGNGGPSNGSNGSNGASHSNGVTHSITPAAQNALAQIAASTIAAANGQKAPAVASASAGQPAADSSIEAGSGSGSASAGGDSVTVDPTIEATPEVADGGSGRGHTAENDQAGTGESTGQQESSSGSGRSRRGSRRSRGQRAAANAAAESGALESSTAQHSLEVPAETPELAPRVPETHRDAVSEPEPHGASAPAPAAASAEGAEKAGVDAKAEVEAHELPILDLPVAPVTAPRQKREDAAKLLDSVLEHLPEPKQPGQGRSRSRRVSTAALSAPVTPPPAD
ncbi:ribonuclease E/G [Subtercola endophyticus]|uniref:ribonuclease E/G n=1 Tax=Subtercola endophyticus TaxID=2895559 RepID=UPI001E4522EE|nr:ribonuclease E/G [Subtercola endophyticus]UFS60855.1 Rne/Rng family ribonuclease [Subtercola endophyticus]